jgi:hypothetical protein
MTTGQKNYVSRKESEQELTLPTISAFLPSYMLMTHKQCLVVRMTSNVTLL